MLIAGSISFAAPWALLGLVVLPVIWWLLRLMPPAPRHTAFPPIRLLLDLKSKEESPAKFPWWLLLLRLAFVVLLILGTAHPLFNASEKLKGKGPLVLVIDDGWASARDWSIRRQTAAALIDRADRERRNVILVTTAPAPMPDNINEVKSNTSGLPGGYAFTAAEARRAIEGLQPKPWPTDRAAALAPLLNTERSVSAWPGHVVWLSDGLEEDGGKENFAQQVLSLQALGEVTVVEGKTANQSVLLRQPVAEGEALKVIAVRSQGKGALSAVLRALADDGRLLAHEVIRFADGENRAESTLVLPAEYRNRLARLEIEDQRNAGAVVLVDERWRRRPVGLVEQPGSSSDQPLLSAYYYLNRALDPYTEVRRGTVRELLARELAVLILADPPPLDTIERQAIEEWVDDGGIVVRFAGPRLIQNGGALLPVEIRSHDRTMGGAMSWNKPVYLVPFDKKSPLYGLELASSGKEIKIKRQVLAKPSLDLADKTWARLSDGTPLITAKKRKKGWLVLVHTTADTTWSDLPLSGLFVNILRRIVSLSQGAVGEPGGPPLLPLETLDGFGRPQAAPANAVAIPAAAFEKTVPGPRHPPGFYGRGLTRRALNLSAHLADPRPVAFLPDGIERQTYGRTTEVDFRPWLLGLALALFLLDLLASLMLRGLLAPISVTAALVLLMAAPDAQAQVQVPTQDDTFAMAASLTTRLAYVVTGNTQVDEISHAGLTGLSVIVNRRTAVELGQPIGIDPEIDELAFFPLLYWPLTSEQRPLSSRATARVNAYLQAGGTVLFDTRQQGNVGAGPGTGTLQRLVGGLHIPPLNPIGPTHVLTRSYYLLDDFPGRWSGGTLWVESPGERINDGVSPVIVGGNDWASAWAMDDTQRYLFAVVPGGEKQREYAFRFGINLVMYTLTGNYKSDQVHLPEILRRLGQ